MARIGSSAGVFTQEVDTTFQPSSEGDIGAALIGPTVKGPAFVPTVVTGRREFINTFGSMNDKQYTGYTANEYLTNGSSLTVIRLLGTSGYSLTNPINIVASSSLGQYSIATLHPTYVVTTDGTDPLFETSTIVTSSDTVGSFVITVSGSYTTDTSAFTGATNKNGTAYSASLFSTKTSWIGNVFGSNADGTEPVYIYSNFKNAGLDILNTAEGDVDVIIETASAESWDFSNQYSEATTPYITSQMVGSSTTNLFRFKTISHGNTSNYEIKVGIDNIRPAGSIAGSEYGQFDVVIRKVNSDKIIGSPFKSVDEDTRPDVVERYTCNLDPDSTNYIGRIIGDQVTTSDSDGKVTVTGDYSNKSKYIRVEVTNGVKNKSISPNLVPFGFKALIDPLPNTFTNSPAASFVTTQTINASYNPNKYFGFNYDFSSTDNLNYLKPLPVTGQQTNGSNIDFLLSNYNQEAGANYPNSTSPYSGSIDLDSANTSVETRKFIVPFQGGFDGWKPNLQKKVGSDINAANSQGFDLANSSAAGYASYKKAIDILSNGDVYDINMLLTPGLLYQYHASIMEYAKNMCEERQDIFYPMDPVGLEANVSTAVSSIQTIDSNYSAAYYPWVKILDTNTNKPVWVPPTVVVGGVISYTDRFSEPWFAPAGLNRGRVVSAMDVRNRLTQKERDTLYDARINPIASFPREGIVIWGQKTLQGRPTALSSVNVRRLLIRLKAFIKSQVRYLVFENNTSTTRNQFLNIVNPFLESVQQRQGLYLFRVRVDETLNTPDVIDRQMLIGEIYIQPAKSIEQIVIPFNITPTGATFE